MSDKKRKVTKSEYARFVREAERVIKLLGLTNWNVHFRLGPIGDKYGRVEYNAVGRVATISCNTMWPDSPFQEFESAARHEVCHLLLSDLCFAAERRFNVSQDEIERLEHDIVRRIEKLTIIV